MIQNNKRLTKNKFLLNDELDELTRILLKYPCRDSLIIRLALATGARAEELLSLQKKDLTNESILIYGNKGSNDREIPLKQELFNDIKSHMEKHSSPLIFPISYSRLVQIWHNYRPVKKKFHSVRHTFALGLYRKTKDILLVQKALGHRSAANTHIYLDYSYSMDEMRKAML